MRTRLNMFMLGRNGVDFLNKHLFRIAAIIAGLNLLFLGRIGSVPFLIAGYALFRTLSRNLPMRQAEDMVARQIKTPIAAMRLLLQDADTDEQRALLEQLQSVEQYVEMVLVFLRLDSSTTDYVIRSHSLDDIVRPAVRKFAGEFIRRRLRLDYQPLDRTVVTDAKWLDFVVEQVLSNALKYTASGSVTIAMDGDDLCIRDTGMGIAPEDLPRIFDRGFTGLNGRRDTRASGIGLYLCRRICRSLGHTIRASSVPNQGTEIRIGLGQKKTLPE